MDLRGYLFLAATMLIEKAKRRLSSAEWLLDGAGQIDLLNDRLVIDSVAG